MLTLSGKKYSFRGIKSGLYVFKRLNTREWLIVDKARMVYENGSIRYFNEIKEINEAHASLDGCPSQVHIEIDD